MRTHRDSPGVSKCAGIGAKRLPEKKSGAVIVAVWKRLTPRAIPGRGVIAVRWQRPPQKYVTARLAAECASRFCAREYLARCFASKRESSRKLCLSTSTPCVNRPDDALANAQLGMTYFKLDQFDQAEQYLLSAKRLDPAHSPSRRSFWRTSMCAGEIARRPFRNSGRPGYPSRRPALGQHPAQPCAALRKAPVNNWLTPLRPV